ncbi:hypothetical protein, partial [Enterobacter hormaechei]|uniref:hypothetical protein n=1 Tax=Enterobacter hormaechei TaxID=158836 RepID=UPI00197F197F
GAASLTREVERLLAATADFHRVQVLLIESDSADDTLATLAGMASRSEHIHFISLGQLAPSWPQRAARLAHCRNAYLEAIRSDPRYRDVDYVLVSDLDGMNGLLDRAALQSCFQVQEAWDVLTANQDGPYYDIWALRHPDWSPDD